MKKVWGHSASSDLTDGQNMVTGKKSKLTVVNLPDESKDNKKKRRVFEDLGNKNVYASIAEKRLKNQDGTLQSTFARNEELSAGVENKKSSGEHYAKNKPSRQKKYVSSAATMVKEKIKKHLRNDNIERDDSISKHLSPPNHMDWRVQSMSEKFTELNIEMPPFDVIDIDEKCQDWFYCPEYAKEILYILKEKEEVWAIKQDFLKDDPEISPHMRSILIDWLIQVQNHLNLHQCTLHRTVSLIDMYLMRKRTLLSKLQLVGITCLFIASKIEERFPPEITRLVHLTDNTYTYDNVIRMELIVLRVLKYGVTPPTATDFFRRYLMCLPPDADLEKMCQYFMDLTLPDFKSIKDFNPSMRAASAVYLASNIMPKFKSNSIPWSRELEYYTGYDRNSLLPCTERLVQMLLKAPVSKFQGAREKFSQTVSHAQCLQEDYLNEFLDSNYRNRIFHKVL